MAKVFLSRKERAPLRFASPASNLGVVLEFSGVLFFGWIGKGEGGV